LAAGIINSEFYKEVNGEGINWVALGGGALLIIASPFTGPLAPFVAAAGIVILSADTVDNCLIENQAGQNWDECGGDIAIDIATAGIFKLVKPLAKPIVEKFGKAIGEKIIVLINKLGQHIDPKAISKVVKEGDELVNMKYMADGAEILTKNSDNSLGKAIQELPQNLDQTAKARFVKNLGEISAKYGDDVADDVAKLRDVKGVDKLAGNIAEQGGGFPFEAKVGRILKQKGKKISELGKPLQKSDGEIDIFLEDKTIYEAKGWTPDNINDLKLELGNKISRFRIEYPNSEINIIRPDNDVYYSQLKEWVIKNGHTNVKIKMVGEI